MKKYIVFELLTQNGVSIFAVEYKYVSEFMKKKAVKTTKTFLEGIDYLAVIRGRVVPVINICSRMGLRCFGGEYYIHFVTDDNKEFLSEIHKVSKITELEKVESKSFDSKSFIVNFVKYKNSAIPVVNPTKLFLYQV